MLEIIWESTGIMAEAQEAEELDNSLEEVSVSDSSSVFTDIDHETETSIGCEACKEEVSLKCGSVKNHIKNKSSREKLACKEAREKDIATCTSLRKHNEEVHLKGEMLRFPS